MPHRFKLLNFFALLICFGCGKDLPELQGFNRELWIADKAACRGHREEMATSIAEQKDKLLALSETDIVKVLGKPDENELYKRNQKFYYYYIKPSSSCDTVSALETSRLIIRFNAMGLAKDITIE